MRGGRKGGGNGRRGYREEEEEDVRGVDGEVRVEFTHVLLHSNYYILVPFLLCLKLCEG